ncbi:MAG TPA: aminotransferase class III-fold pyridoxal phosphate-dependent enzyme [Candidatus Lokiarchaeia archaeon]|nr:aminotransferase class III-fold pyridoxal phosphate-dependent enzyme [Candidatus Lokiarchaeia archaeon]
MNVDEIYEKINSIQSQPVIQVPENVLIDTLKNFDIKFAKSKLMHQDLVNAIPGGIEHTNAIQHPFPVVMDRAQDCYLWDIDGNQFIDYLMGSGPIILGHNYPELRDFIIELIQEKSPLTGFMTEYELLAAKKIIDHVKSVQQVRFFQTGTEVAMEAARLARVYTGKTKIIKMDGSYHGWSDQFLIDLHIQGTKNILCQGIPPSVYEHTISVKPDDADRLEKVIKRNEGEGKGGVAAVFIEPPGGEGGTHPLHPEYYKAVREICDKYNVVYVMDEVITGFRLALGGAQEFFGVDADLTMFGKIVGHGYPSAGALGGRADIMQYLAGGVGSTDEEGKSIKKNAYASGTLAGNTLTCAAAYKAIECLEKTGAIDIAARVASKLCDELNDVFQRNELPFFTYNFQSILHIVTADFFHVSMNRPDAMEQIDLRRKLMNEYVAMMAIEGITSLQGVRHYTCLMHDQPEVIEQTIAAYESFCKKLKS